MTESFLYLMDFPVNFTGGGDDDEQYIRNCVFL